jgi:hypothetical protein
VAVSATPATAPAAAAAPLRLVETLLAARRPEEAEAVLQRLTRQGAGNAETLAALAALLADQGR